MASANKVGNSLSGATGSDAFAGSTSAVFVSPILGAASATSISFSSTSEIIGSTTNDSAAGGSVGQYVSGQRTAASATSVTNLSNTTITSISLTAGDWDVFGNVFFIPGASTTIKYLEVWTGTNTTTPDDSKAAVFSFVSAGSLIPAPGIGQEAPYQRFSLSGTTTILVNIRASITGSSGTACGFISARRIR